MLAVDELGAVSQQLRGVEVGARATGFAVLRVELVDDVANLGEGVLGDLAPRGRCATPSGMR
jgi:hypothetical protein